MLEKYRQLSERLKISIEQVFCRDIVQKGGTSLVTFKGTLATSIKKVSPHHMDMMVWFFDYKTGKYWRFTVESVRVSKYGSTSGIFKVDMDGKILGMYPREGAIITSEEALGRQGRHVEQSTV